MSIYQKKIEYIASYQKTIDNIKNNISTPIITHNYPDYPDIKPNLNEYIFIDKPYHLEIIKKKEFDRIDKNHKSVLGVVVSLTLLGHEKYRKLSIFYPIVLKPMQ